MGLDANYPAIVINNLAGTVTVYNQDHVPIGTLGPDDHFHSARANVTCITKAWDDASWYRLLNPSGFDLPATSAYVSADEVHVFHPAENAPVPDCANVGCVRKAAPKVVVASAVGAAILWWRKRRP